MIEWHTQVHTWWWLPVLSTRLMVTLPATRYQQPLTIRPLPIYTALWTEACVWTACLWLLPWKQIGQWSKFKPSQSQVQCPNHCITSHCSVYNTHVCLLFVGGPVPVCCVCVCLRTVINGWSSACERLWERRRWPPDVAFSQWYVRHISSCEAVHSSNMK